MKENTKPLLLKKGTFIIKGNKVKIKNAKI